MPEPTVNPQSIQPTLEMISTELQSLGVHQIASFAWRDLDDPDAGGSEVHADQVFSRWASTGLQIAHRTSSASRSREFERNGYQVEQRAGRYGVFPRVITHQLLSKHHYDAVIEIWNGVPWFSSLWARRPHVTWLHHIHTDMWKESLPAPLAPFGRLLEGTIAPPFYKAHPVITLAPATSDHLLSHGYRPDLVHVIAPGIDASFTSLNATPRSSWPLICAVGRLAPVKQFDALIKRMKIITQQLPEARLVIVGDGPQRAELQDLIDDLGLTQQVSLLGHISNQELVSLYQSSWLLTSASHSEGWGMTITEAAACGTPCVVLDNDGHRAAVRHSVSGLIAPTLDDLGLAVLRVLLEPPLQKTLSDGALLHAESLTWDATATRTLGVLLDETKRQQTR